MPSIEEEVLVIPTVLLARVGMFQGLCVEVHRYAPSVLDPANFRFMPRTLAENDPDWKQLIPYVILKYRDQLFHYTRGKAGSEQRLRALRSIGIGGHINPVDLAAGEHPYLQGMRRELAEDVIIDTTFRESCLGFINDDSTPVGQVHLGIVHVFELEAPRVQRRETQLVEVGFAPITELSARKDTFETWSQFVLSYVAESDPV